MQFQYNDISYVQVDMRTQKGGGADGVLLPHTVPGLSLGGEVRVPQVGKAMGKRSNKNCQPSGERNSLMYLQYLLGWGGEEIRPPGVRPQGIYEPQLNKNLASLPPRARLSPGPGLPGCYSHGANPKLYYCVFLTKPFVMLPLVLRILFHPHMQDPQTVMETVGLSSHHPV